jgi:hypothetical protein
LIFSLICFVADGFFCLPLLALVLGMRCCDNSPLPLAFSSLTTSFCCRFLMRSLNDTFRFRVKPDVSTVAIVVVVVVVVADKAVVAIAVAVDDDDEDVRFSFTVGEVGLKLAFLENDP